MCLYGKIAANKHIHRSKMSPLCKSNKLVGRCNIRQTADEILKERERRHFIFSDFLKYIFKIYFQYFVAAYRNKITSSIWHCILDPYSIHLLILSVDFGRI